METLNDMENLINKIRQTLYLIINEKNDLLDIEVVAVSQILDVTLNKYNKLLEEAN
ncbi:Spo0E family sporulation regulatory protein-aspartic acid phosphatase [Clostridium sp.]|uniref:Spo0E family sporulation regulatory protein-aspartic acid phosphatase n=1 Tax=Clostridium sp. TaxID=1506 RepID=UPI0028516C77|nr:Spo0E family sporulation regulatory protein-aspartic acid phosphatase [Clostridium sp.]MDR3596677.1 Spo0E family sporulation regulatory protein-aspartic acid phosphatase [Clostridium sp.]